MDENFISKLIRDGDVNHVVGPLVGAGAAAMVVITIGARAFDEAMSSSFGQVDGSSVLFVSGTVAIVVALGVRYVIKRGDTIQAVFRNLYDEWTDDGDDEFGGDGGEGYPQEPEPSTPREEFIVQDNGLEYDLDESSGVFSNTDMRGLLRAEHTLLIAGTGAGKTTFIHALMAMGRENSDHHVFYVIDGKPNMMQWDRLWNDAAAKIHKREMFVPALEKMRQKMYERMNYQGAPVQFRHIHLILDEAPEITGKSEEAVQIVSDLLRLGRSFRIHVWLTSQGATVAQLGFSGQVDLLKHNTHQYWLERQGDDRLLFHGNLSSGVLSKTSEGHVLGDLSMYSPQEDNSLPFADDEVVQLNPDVPTHHQRASDPVIEQLFSSGNSDAPPLRTSDAPLDAPPRAPLDAPLNAPVVTMVRPRPNLDVTAVIQQGLALRGVLGDQRHESYAGTTVGQAAAVAYIVSELKSDTPVNVVIKAVWGGKNGSRASSYNQIYNEVMDNVLNG